MKDLPEEQEIAWPKQVAWWAIESGEEATRQQKELALEVAELCTKKAKALDPTSEAYVTAYGPTEVRFVQAEALAALAFAHDLNGDARKAKRTAEEALTLAGEELRPFLEPLLAEN